MIATATARRVASASLAAALAAALSCGPTYGREQLCSDRIDNDLDNAIDCADPDCQGRACAEYAQCLAGRCRPDTCADAARNGDEIDVDCGGPTCAPCADGQACAAGRDCAGGVCVGGRCAPCGRTFDCGNVLNDGVAYLVCLRGKCFAPGPVDPATGRVIEFEHSASAVYERYYTTVATVRPRTLILRFVYPVTVSGRRLTCPDLLGLSGAGTECTRSALDRNGEVNQVYRQVINLNWTTASGSQVVFNNLLGGYVAGEEYLFLAETWWGARTLGDQNESVPTGNRAGVYCLDTVRLYNQMPTLQAHFYEPCGDPKDPASQVHCPQTPPVPCCNGSTLVSYAGAGSCAPAGNCGYTETSQSCLPRGCTAGACQ